MVAFVAGAVAVWARSDLKVPEQLYQALTIYLLLAIGFKGGGAIADTPLGQLALPIGATLALGSLIPFLAYGAARRFLRTNVADSAALAAHYGSVSAVTFMACLAFLDRLKVSYESFLPAVMAVMEIPAILVALMIARLRGERSRLSLRRTLMETLAGKSFVLLLCGLVAGLLAGPDSREMIKPFLVAPFYGALMIFLLEMGQVAAGQLGKAKEVGGRLLGFAVLLPVLQGLLGLVTGWAIGFSQGGAVVFAVLAASASYIAAPAAVRAALPQANPGIYVTASLGITFPFNLALGIPLYYLLSGYLY